LLPICVIQIFRVVSVLMCPICKAQALISGSANGDFCRDYLLSLYNLFVLHSFPESQPKTSIAICTHLPDPQHPMGNTRDPSPLYSILKPAVVAVFFLW